MSVGDDAPAAATTPSGLEPAEVKTLDSGFQRVLVAIVGVLLSGFAALSAWLVYRVYAWAAANPDQTVPIVGTFKEPGRWLNELGVVIGLSAALIYGILYWITPEGDPGGYGEATSTNFTLGITAMAAARYRDGAGLPAGGVCLGAGSRCHRVFPVPARPGIDRQLPAELFQHRGARSGSHRSAGHPADADAYVGLALRPAAALCPERGYLDARAAGSWSDGTPDATGDRSDDPHRHRRILFPRRAARASGGARALGWAAMDEKGQLLSEAILRPGLHLALPWPIDELVYIPTQELQLTNVGTELHTPKEWKGVDFQFWTLRENTEADADVEDLFFTGDRSTSGDNEAAPQILETYVQVRGGSPIRRLFYSTISHSEFFQKSADNTTTMPIYEAIVQQCTSFAVTRAFAIHTLNQIMIGDRREVEEHCRDILQQKLDLLGHEIGLPGSGIHVEYLTIKDLHPPYWRPDRYDPSEPRIGGKIVFTDNGIDIQEDPNRPSRMKRGPASAFEFANSMREFQQQLLSEADAYVTVQMNDAQGFAESEKRRAEADKLDRVARAHGDADRLVKMTEGIDPKEQKYQLELMEQQLLYRTLKDLVDSPNRTFDQVNKIIVDPSVKDVDLYQSTDKGLVPAPTIRP